MFSILREMASLSVDGDLPSTPASERAAIFSRSKKALGGSEIGMIAKIGNEEHLVKAGVSRSLLGQALTHHAAGKPDAADKLLGHIVNDSIRLIEGSQKTEIKQSLTNAFRAFCETEPGKILMAKASKGELTIADVSHIHSSLVHANPELRNSLGVPIFLDVINAAASQDLVNALQRTYLSKDQIPDSALLTFPDNALVGSRLVAPSTPLDAFLMQPFMPPGCTIADARAAASLVKAANSGKQVNPDEVLEAQALIAKVQSPANILAGTHSVTEALGSKGLDGLFTSLLARLTLGESDDLGPDNMLVVAGDDGRNKVVSVDVTGFRYEREKDFQANPQDKPRHGWGKLIADPDLASNVLLDRSVLSNRYARGFDLIHDAIVGAMRETLQPLATPEVEAARDWYASLDPENTAASLHALATGLNLGIETGLMPDATLMNRALSRNADFVSKATQTARRYAAPSPAI